MSTEMSVTATVAAGESMVINVNGQEMAIAVPKGIEVGQNFDFQVAAPEVAVATPVATPMATPVSANVALTAGEEEWDSIFNCFADVPGCAYIYCCFPCARCEIGNAMGQAPIGPKNEPAKDFLACGGQLLNFLTLECNQCCFCGMLIGFCACPEKTCCAYDMEVIKGYSKLAKKKTETPGPFDCLFLDCICCYACIYCLIYRELKLTPCGGQKEAPTFSSIDRT